MTGARVPHGRFGHPVTAREAALDQLAQPRRRRFPPAGRSPPDTRSAIRRARTGSAARLRAFRREAPADRRSQDARASADGARRSGRAHGRIRRSPSSGESPSACPAMRGARARACARRPRRRAAIRSLSTTRCIARAAQRRRLARAARRRSTRDRRTRRARNWRRAAHRRRRPLRADRAWEATARGTTMPAPRRRRASAGTCP